MPDRQVFLEVITRSMPGRALDLAACHASLMELSSDNWTQTILMDPEPNGSGMAWAQAQLADFTPSGRYVWILDDDDRCIRPTLVDELEAIAENHEPQVIFMRMDHGRHGVKPDNGHWGKRPVVGHIGCSAFVVRADVWLACREAWRSARYQSDYDFAAAVYDHCERRFWHDVVASRITRQSQGAPV